jgi:hypothetical protein
VRLSVQASVVIAAWRAIPLPSRITVTGVLDQAKNSGVEGYRILSVCIYKQHKQHTSENQPEQIRIKNTVVVCDAFCCPLSVS